MPVLSFLRCEKVQRLKDSEQNETKRNLLTIKEISPTDATKVQGLIRMKNAQRKFRYPSGSQTGPSSAVVQRHHQIYFGFDSVVFNRIIH